MGKLGSRQYKHKPTGKMIKEIKQMAPGKKIGGQMVYPMSATRPYGIGSAFKSFGNALNKGARAATRPLNKQFKTGAFKKTNSQFSLAPGKATSNLNLASNSKKASNASSLASSNASLKTVPPIPSKPAHLQAGTRPSTVSAVDPPQSMFQKVKSSSGKMLNKVLVGATLADIFGGIDLPGGGGDKGKSAATDGIGYGPTSTTTNSHNSSSHIINNYYGGGKGKKPVLKFTPQGGGPATMDKLVPEKYVDQDGRILSK